MIDNIRLKVKVSKDQVIDFILDGSTDVENCSFEEITLFYTEDGAWRFERFESISAAIERREQLYMTQGFQLVKDGAVKTSDETNWRDWRNWKVMIWNGR